MIDIKINGISRTSQIDWHSYQLINVLTKEIDTLEFNLKVHSGKTYKPSLGQEVIVSEDGTKIYGGYIVEAEKKIEAMVQTWRITCKDYHYGLDRKLVYKNFKNEYAGDIIKYIATNYTSGFTTDNVSLGNSISSIRFNYETVSRAIQQIAERINYDWYVDENKDIHFFSKESYIAPFELNDVDGNFIWNSLIINEHINQIKNSIFVQGGIQSLGHKVFKDRGNGITRTFSTRYEMENLTVKKGGIVQTLGKDGIDDPVAVDCLYNPDKYLIIFREDNKPADGVEIEISGNASMPVFVHVKDQFSVLTYGEFQFRIVDKSILSQLEAKQKALAELEKYKSSTSEVIFRTRSNGLKVGQRITLNSAILDINKNFTINRTISKIKEGVVNEKIYEVSLIGSEQIGIIEVLKRLIIDDTAKNVEITQYEILYRYFKLPDEIFRMAEISLSFSKTSPPYTWEEAGIPEANPIKWNKFTWT